MDVTQLDDDTDGYSTYLRDTAENASKTSEQYEA